MGLPGIFKYLNQEKRLDTDFGLRGIFRLLRPLAPVFHKPGMDYKNISH